MKKDINELVKENIDCFGWEKCSNFPKTFEDLRKYYESINQEIQTLLEKKEKYDQLINKDDLNENTLTFKDKFELYTIVKDLHAKNSTYKGISLFPLNLKLMCVFEDVSKYFQLIERLNECIKIRSTIREESINFEHFGGDEYYHERCFQKHYLAKFDDELVCMSCGATTKDYSLTKEDVDFLTLCAVGQGLLLKGLKKDDIPLLNVLMEQRDYYKKQRETDEKLLDNEDYTLLEEYWLEDELEISNINRDIRKAHLLDKGLFMDENTRVYKPKCLSSKQAAQLLDEIDKQLIQIEQTDSRFKDLLLEECRTAKYEVLILSGNNIPTLLENATDELEKTALTKAYYNVSKQDFITNSDYFKTNTENEYYDCITANPEINQKILDMKIRR